MLQYVQLSGNQFNILPNFEDHWSFVEELYLDKCHLEVSLICYYYQALPESIGSLQRLRVLNIGNNLLSSLPDSLGNLRDIEEFVVNSNQLTSLPSYIGNFAKLRVFVANSNCITDVPESLAGMNWIITVMQF